MIVYKALSGGQIAKLEIPAEAKRTACLVSRKCRAEFARVLQIWGVDKEESKEGFDKHSRSLRYIVGELIYPDSYDNDPLVDCSHGIHFFLTREEAEEWA